MANLQPRDIQRLLTAAGYYNAGIDGNFGPKSKEAVKKILDRNKPEATKWSEARQRIAAVQIILNAAGYNAGTVDGYMGPNTRNAFDEWDYYVTNGKKLILPERTDPVINSSTGASPTKWPKQKDVPTFFGKAGSPACTAGKAQLPFAFRIAWNKSQKVKSFSCHTKVADALTSIFAEAAKHYGEAAMVSMGLDLFGGCYNYRPMRNGSSLSMHAYGIAVDLDPERNQLSWGRDKAAFAKPSYDVWWRIVESHGALSLGRARNYDWMHFQFATL